MHLATSYLALPSLCLCASLAVFGCATEGTDGSEPLDWAELAVAQQPLASNTLRVALVGNSQLGFSGSNPTGLDNSIVGQVLRELSEKANLMGNPATPAAKIVVTGLNAGLSSCAQYEQQFIARITPNSFDVVILQPPLYEYAPDATVLACWQRWRQRAIDNGAEFGMMSGLTPWKEGNLNWYTAQRDVMQESAMRTFAAQQGSLFVPAAGVVRSILGANPSDDAFNRWYEDDQAHPSARGHFTYATALYQYITWRAWQNASPPPSQLMTLSTTEAPTAADAYAIGLYEQAALSSRHVAFKANGNTNKNLVTAENQGNASLVTRTTQVGSWERFTVKNAAGGKVAITATVNSKYVCAEDGGNQPLIANRTAIGDWEKFEPVRIGGPNFALLAVNGKFVTFNANGTTPAIANSSTAGDAQKFTAWYP